MGDPLELQEDLYVVCKVDQYNKPEIRIFSLPEGTEDGFKKVKEYLKAKGENIEEVQSVLGYGDMTSERYSFSKVKPKILDEEEISSLKEKRSEVARLRKESNKLEKSCQ